METGEQKAQKEFVEVKEARDKRVSVVLMDHQVVRVWQVEWAPQENLVSAVVQGPREIRVTKDPLVNRDRTASLVYLVH